MKTLKFMVALTICTCFSMGHQDHASAIHVDGGLCGKKEAL
ncbi:MAG: hypothetical protein H6Q06_2976 [Acidobacteria bacterium]|nr:hypothetical protein [Acidobacteriota bacterium]